MNLKDIKELIQEFDASGVHRLSLEMEDVKLELEKESAPAMMAPPMPQMPMPMPQMQPAPAPQAAPAVAAAAPADAQVDDGVAVKSPVVGTFYASSAPGAKPFVTVGQKVNQGDTLCIVEAMKMMNEITAPVSGVVSKILVTEEEMVQFDQTIMLIKE